MEFSPKQEKQVVRRGGLVFEPLRISNGTDLNIKRSESLQITQKSNTLPDLLSGNTMEKKTFVDQKSALATLDALMSEVQEATTVAKQQHEEKNHKEVIFRRSRSLSDLTKEVVTEVDGAPPSGGDGSRVPPFVHQKTESFGQSSLRSGSVFLSEPDISYDENVTTNAGGLNQNVECNDKKKSLHDIVMDTDFAVLTELLMKKVSGRSNTIARSQTLSAKQKNAGSDYGLAHLEQICKLMEQIANLRTENQSLKKIILSLENEVLDLKSGFEMGQNDFYQFPRSKQVRSNHGNLPIRNNAEYNGNVESKPRGSSQSTLILDQAPPDVEFDGSFPPPGYGSVISDRPVIFSNVSLKKNNKRRLYARDDLELSNKGRWRFWKAPANKVDNSSSKKQIVTSIKNQHTQGSATHLKSGSVTLDSLLDNLDDNFSKKMIQWQSATRQSRAPSRASLTSTEAINRNVQSSSSKTSQAASDDNNKIILTSQSSKSDEPSVNSKGSIKKRMSRWGKVTRKLSWHGDFRRSKSFDRMNDEVDQSRKSSLLFYQQSREQKDFYKSMPCVLTDSQGSPMSHGSLSERDGRRSTTEWSALQETFPTSKPVNPIRRLISASQSRLAAPLRKKSNKRRSWSFTKRPTSKFFLPNSGDFTSSTEQAESIGDQYSLQLDQDDVKSIGVNDDELQYLKRNTADLREKLKEMEKVHEDGDDVIDDVEKQQRPKPRPASSMARYHNDPSARSSRHLRLDANNPLYSCNHGNQMMSPLKEEDPESSQPPSSNRRHTISSWYLTGTSGAPEQPSCESGDSLVTPVVSYVTQKVSKVIRNDPPLLRHNQFDMEASNKNDVTPGLPLKDGRKENPQKKSSVNLLSHLVRFSPKSRNKTFLSSDSKDSDTDSPAAPGGEAKHKKKKRNIFRNLTGRHKSLSDDTKKNKPPDHDVIQPQIEVTLTNDSLTSPSDDATVKHTSKIAELKHRLSVGSNPSRRPSLNSDKLEVRRGLVHRLSKRFNNKSQVKTLSANTNNNNTNNNNNNKFLVSSCNRNFSY